MFRNTSARVIVVLVSLALGALGIVFFQSAVGQDAIQHLQQLLNNLGNHMPEWLSGAGIWIGIVACLAGSASCSGLTLGLFSKSKLELTVLERQQNKAATKVLKLRKDANKLLATLLWSNVAVNVLLTLLVDQAIPGAWGFLFSVFGITIIGEILPQAYFSRNALRMGALFAPLVRILMFCTSPLSYPSALMLNFIVGPEGLTYHDEEDMEVLIELHIQAPETDITELEGKVAKQAFRIDDKLGTQEGELLHKDSIISDLPFVDDKPQFPKIAADRSDPFLQKLSKSREKWVVFLNSEGLPCLVIDARTFICELFMHGNADPTPHCHVPIVASCQKVVLGDLISKLHVDQEHADDNVIDDDVILYWPTEEDGGRDNARIITLTDIGSYLLDGVVVKKRKRV